MPEHNVKPTRRMRAGVGHNEKIGHYRQTLISLLFIYQIINTSIKNSSSSTYISKLKNYEKKMQIFFFDIKLTAIFAR